MGVAGTILSLGDWEEMKLSTRILGQENGNSLSARACFDFARFEDFLGAKYTSIGWFPPCPNPDSRPPLAALRMIVELAYGEFAAWSCESAEPYFPGFHFRGAGFGTAQAHPAVRRI